MKEELAEYGLHEVHSNEPDRKVLDVNIVDDDGKVWAEVWGDEPFGEYDVEVNCKHPAVEFDDDEHVGECPICGSLATWHWEESADDGYTIKEQVVDSWEQPDEVGGIIGNYINILRGLCEK